MVETVEITVNCGTLGLLPINQLLVSMSHDQWSITWLDGCWMKWDKELGSPSLKLMYVLLNLNPVSYPYTILYQIFRGRFNILNKALVDKGQQWLTAQSQTVKIWHVDKTFYSVWSNAHSLVVFPDPIQLAEWQLQKCEVILTGEVVFAPE